MVDIQIHAPSNVTVSSSLDANGRTVLDVYVDAPSIGTNLEACSGKHCESNSAGTAPSIQMNIKEGLLI